MDELYLQVLILSAFMVVLIGCILTIASKWIFPKRRFYKPMGKHVGKNVLLENKWILFPVLVIAYFFILTAYSMPQLKKFLPVEQHPEMMFIGQEPKP